jgi:hypothetical protein
MRNRTRRPLMRASILALHVTLALTLATAMPALAQDTSHPAGIFFGTCAEPGNALVTLWDTSPSFLVEGAADVGESLGSAAGFPVEASVTTVEMPLADLLATEHAILVHRSQAEMEDALVCGDIGGPTLGADELPVALAPVGLSPWSGVALLEVAGDETTTVSLYVFEGPGMDAAADSASVGPFALPFPSVLRDAVTDSGIVTAHPTFEDEADDGHDRKDKHDKHKDKKDHGEKDHEKHDADDHDDDDD